MCFGARNHQFGRFLMPSSGRLAAIKLVHLYGYVSCRANEANRWSYWGCGGDPLFVAVTTSTNRVLFPPKQFKDNSKEFRIKAYNSWSPELVFSVFSHPHWVSLGQHCCVCGIPKICGISMKPIMAEESVAMFMRSLSERFPS